MELKIKELEDNVRLLMLQGSLDMNGTYEIQVDFVRACEGDDMLILVDLSKVSYISSVGIPMLVNTAKSVMEYGGKFALLNPQKKVAEVLELTGIAEVIRIYSDLETALADLTLS